METPETSDSCIICDKPNALRCKRCRSASYCSKLCQRGDYPTHKLLCASFSNFDLTKRPSDEHLRAILFPVDKKRPQFIWLHCKWEDDDECPGGRWQCPNHKPFVNNGHSVNVRYNDVLARPLSDLVCLCYSDTALIDGSARNSSVVTTIGTRPVPHFDWHGPMVASGLVGSSFDPLTCRDIDMNDFRHLADYFVSYGSNRTSISAVPPAAPTVKGVRINCLGDQKLFNRSPFEAVELPRTTPSPFIPSLYEHSDIAKRIGLPILTQRLFPHPNWANRDTKEDELFGTWSPYNNQDATFLHLCIDPKVQCNFSKGILGWGWAPDQWQHDVGSVVVIREDRKPLLPSHVEALCRYCRYDARDWVAHSMGEYAPDESMSKDLVLSMICRPTFSICWYRMCKEKHKEGVHVDDPFPYDV